jgi:hypothetical protein
MDSALAMQIDLIALLNWRHSDHPDQLKQNQAEQGNTACQT